MRKVGIVIICVVVVCVVLGVSVPSYSRIKLAVEEVSSDADFVLTDFLSFGLLYDVFTHSFQFDDLHDVKLYTELVHYDDGYYLELFGSEVSDPDVYFTISSYYLSDSEDYDYVKNLYNNVLRPSRLIIKAHNDIVGVESLPDFLIVEIASVLLFFRSLLFYFLGIIIAAVFIIVDTFGVFKALIICLFKIIGLIPVTAY